MTLAEVSAGAAVPMKVTADGEIFIQQGARALIIILPSLANLTNKPDANKQRMITLAKTALARL